MNKVRVIATDLDGTLLHNRSTISKKNLIALKRFICDDGIVCFVTGRCFVSAKSHADKFYSKTGCKIHFLSCLKGAVLYDNIENKFIYQRIMSANITSKILAISKQTKCCFAAYFEKDIYNKNMWIYGNNKIVWLLNKIRILPNCLTIADQDTNEASYKINISGFKFNLSIFKQLKALQNCYQQIKSKLGGEIDIAKTSKYMYEITSKNSNKGIAIKTISELLKIDLNEFAAFGDSANDIEMMKLVGLPIAIGNKNCNLNKIVKHSIIGLQKNAVGKAINKYIYLGKK